VALRVATDADPRQGVREGAELVKEVARVGVAARGGLRGVAADHERLVGAGVLEMASGLGVEHLFDPAGAGDGQRETAGRDRQQGDLTDFVGGRPGGHRLSDVGAR